MYRVKPAIAITAFVPICSFLLLFSCGPANDGDGVSRPPDPEGSWQTTCVTLDDASSWPTARGLDVYSDGEVTKELTFYSDDSCRQSSVTQKITGSFVVGDASDGGVYKTILRLISWTFRPETASQAQEFSDQSACGVSSWQQGSAESVLGKTCSGSTYPEAGAEQKNLMQIRDDEMFIGDLAGEVDGEGYPVALSTLPINSFERQ